MSVRGMPESHLAESHLAEKQLATPLGQLVAGEPARAQVFERHGINFWCQGARPLGDALAEMGIDPALIVREMSTLDNHSPAGGEKAWSHASFYALLDHLRTTHHAFLKEELPELSVIVGKVTILHGDANSDLHELDDAFEWFRSEMEMLMRKEEVVLFPMCLRLEQARVRPHFFSGTIQGPIREIAEQHKAAAYALERMYALTNQFSPPPDACDTYMDMVARLFRLNLDTHQHVHEENNILFPRALDLEQSLSESSATG